MNKNNIRGYILLLVIIILGSCVIIKHTHRENRLEVFTNPKSIAVPPYSKRGFEQNKKALYLLDNIVPIDTAQSK